MILLLFALQSGHVAIRATVALMLLFFFFSCSYQAVLCDGSFLYATDYN